MDYLMVAMGGGLGAMLRWFLGHVIPRPANYFPLATFLINIGGAFMIGLFAALAVKYGFKHPGSPSSCKPAFAEAFRPSPPSRWRLWHSSPMARRLWR